MRATDLLNEYDTAKECERVKALYELQLAKIKNEEYIRDLILEDLSHKIKQNRSRYDVMKSVFKTAAAQIGEKDNEDRYDLELLKSWIAEDFFNNKDVFEIIEIVAQGYETYGYHIKLKINDKMFYIDIPIVSNWNCKTIEYSSWKFKFGRYESSYYCVMEKASFNMHDVAEYIVEKFELGDE